MPAPFEIDPERLRDVDSRGRVHRIPAPIGWLDPRHRALLGWAALGSAVLAGLAALTVGALALGARLWAAGFALAVVAAAPLLGAGPLLDWWRHRRR